MTARGIALRTIILRGRVESQETGDIIVQHDPLTDTRSTTGSAAKSGARGGDERQRERYAYRPTRPPDGIGAFAERT